MDTIFASLADPVRRDILERVAQFELTVNEIALHYDISLAAVSKHLKVLELADLITKRKEGRKVMVMANREAITQAEEYLAGYRQYQQRRFDALEQTINERE
ncbi:MAG TPA: metalloregulator ArsR/SmtB family transcription factor [Candidatus Saccharimonadales bacterium]